MSIEAMKQALEALEDWKTYMHGHWDVIDEQAITSLRQAIAEAEGISIKSIEHPIGPQADGDINPDSLEEIEIDLPKREWVGLTSQEYDEIYANNKTVYDAMMVVATYLKRKNT